MAEYAGGLALVILFTVLAYWRGNPVLFMLAAGASIMVGLYTPDALKGLNYSNFGVTIGLMVILYSFLCIGLAFANAFREVEV
jgi:hypothetical protein